jgi:hypothetical protein
MIFLIFGQIASTHATYKVGTYHLRFRPLGLPKYNTLVGNASMSVAKTPQLHTDFDHYTDVTTITYAPFIVAKKRIDAALLFETFNTYFDNQGREICFAIIAELNFTELYRYRIELQSYRGNYTGVYPSWSAVFAATPGTNWTYTFGTSAYVSISSLIPDLTLPKIEYDDLKIPFVMNNTNIRVHLELMCFETKTVGAGEFDCARLKQSIFENTSNLGYTYIYRTQIGREYPLIFQEDYDPKGKSVLLQELISLELLKMVMRPLFLLPGGLIVVIIIWRTKRLT